MATKKITIPNAWVPRDYQLPLWAYLEQGGKHAVAVWHRRAGKDSLALNWTAVAAHMRVGVYWHMLPTQKQGRKVVWDGIDKQGRRMIDQVFPEAIRKSTNNQEMRIELKCGSIWQVVGSDNYDSLVGANPVGVVHSEFSVANPAARRFLSPILKENGGWEVYIYTPRGKNHGHKLFRMAETNPKWYAEILTLEQSGAYPIEIVQEERDEGMVEELIQQEYYCSFDSAIMGSYFGKLLSRLDKDGGCGDFPYDPKYPVITAWDFGVDDDTIIWFFQLIGTNAIHIIDRHVDRGYGMDHYAKVILEKPYVYSDHIFPHDGNHRGKWCAETGTAIFEKLTNQAVTVIDREQNLKDDVGVQAVRSIIPRCRFNMSKVSDGFEALALYRSVYDEKTALYLPLHDWTSHDASAFKAFALAHQDRRGKSPKRQVTAEVGYDALEFGQGGTNRQQLVVDDYDIFG